MKTKIPARKTTGAKSVPSTKQSPEKQPSAKQPSVKLAISKNATAPLPKKGQTVIQLRTSTEGSTSKAGSRKASGKVVSLKSHQSLKSDISKTVKTKAQVTETTDTKSSKTKLALAKIPAGKALVSTKSATPALKAPIGVAKVAAVKGGKLVVKANVGGAPRSAVGEGGVAERLAAARAEKSGAATARVVAPKTNLKLVAKAVDKVAVSKITRSEPTNPHTHRDNSSQKVIAGKFGGDQPSTKPMVAVRPGLSITPELSSAEPVSFKAGDKIVYPGHGVGEIEGVRVTMLGGEEHHIYNIKILDSGMKVMVPLSQASSVGLRKIIDKRAIDQVYEILKDRDFKIDTQTWNRRFREYSQKIKTGSVYEIAIVLRDLSVLSEDKELSFGEKKMLDMAESLLVSEIAIAKARPHDKIVGELRELFA